MATSTRPGAQIPAAPELVALVEGRRDEIRDRCVRLLKSLGRTRYPDRSMEELQSWTEDGLGALAAALAAGSVERLDPYIDRLSRTRRRQGFAVGEVVEGLLCLREAVASTLLERESAGEEVARKLSSLDACVRYLLSNFTADYTRGESESLRQERDRLQRATARLLEANDVDQVLRTIRREARRLSGSPATAVDLHSDRQERRRGAAHRPTLGPTEELRQRRRTGDGSVLAFPLRFEQQEFGTLLVVAPDPPRRDHITLLRIFGKQAAAALANALLHEQGGQLAALEERQRLAHELHDSVTQSLYGATMYTEAAIRLLEADDRPRARRVLEELRATALDALRQMRLLIFDLRPSILEDEGLANALEARLAAVEARAGLETEFQTESLGQLPPKVEEALFGIAREAMNNVLKHAAASRIRVGLRRRPKGLELEIVDNGSGFDPKAAERSGGLGIAGMKERAAEIGATLSVTAEPNGGTRVLVVVPPAAEEEP